MTTECEECGEDAKGFDLCIECAEALNAQEDIDDDSQCEDCY